MKTRNVIGCVCAVLLTIILAANIPKERDNLVERPSTVEFREKLQRLEVTFPEQVKTFWKSVKIRSEIHLSSQPRRPLVFIIAACLPTANTSLALAQSLANSVSTTRALTIDGSDYMHTEGSEAEFEIGELLKSHLTRYRGGSVVINHLELLPPPSPFLFYSFCDNEDSPYPNASFFFITHLNKTLEPDRSLEAEKQIKQFLSEEVWSSGPFYETSSVQALINRVVDVVLVTAEDERSKGEGNR